jgi:gamma-glutamylcyclotransferase (GGCT)/AIG2-like uncharacterized protein YtfP
MAARLHRVPITCNPSIKPADCDRLFAYGTLRRGSQHPLAHRLADASDFVGRATYQGRLFLVENYPGVIAANNPHSIVHGDVYRLHQPHLLLPILDDYEECGPAFPQPAEYVRAIQTIRLACGSKCFAWIYLYNRKIADLKPLASGDFFAV